MNVFPDLPMFQGINAPSRVEADLKGLEVVGEIPPEIDGAYYRVAPDHQFPPRFENDVPFNADGLVSMFRIRDGRVDMRSRYVRTDRFLAERRAGRALFGRYRNKWTDDPSVAGMDRNLANTNILIHGGVLLALREDSPPVAMDPETLETIGNWDFHGTLPGPTCSAHCKVDPVTGNLVGFGYAAKGDFSRDVVYFEVNPEGRVIHSAWFELPYYEMQHDFGVARDYVAFPVAPIKGVGDEGLKQGLPHFAWDSAEDSYMAVLPRMGRGDDIRWFRNPNQFASHVMNAWNEGTKVHLDLCRSSINLFPFFHEIGKPWSPAGLDVRLTRWTANLAANREEFDSATLSEFIGEFPRNDDRYQTLPYRHGWLLGFYGTRNAIAHVDLATGETEVWEAPADKPLQEPCFIPRGPGAAEGDGWIIQAATDTTTMLTELNLFEALAIAKGPIATIRLPFRMKPAIHTSWADGALVRSPGLPARSEALAPVA